LKIERLRKKNATLAATAVKSFEIDNTTASGKKLARWEMRKKTK
jgi:hypothetical protein